MRPVPSRQRPSQNDVSDILQCKMYESRLTLLLAALLKARAFSAPKARTREARRPENISCEDGLIARSCKAEVFCCRPARYIAAHPGR